MQDKIQEIMGLVDAYANACEHELAATYHGAVSYGDSGMARKTIESKLRELVDAQIRMGECVGCGHLYMEPLPSQCDCLNNTENKYLPWVASRAHGINNTSGVE